MAPERISVKSSGISLLLALLMMLTTSCGARVRTAAEGASRAAVPATVDATLTAGEDPRTRTRVAEIVATPEVERAIGEIARSAVAAGLDEATTAASERKIAELTDVVAKAIVERLAQRASGVIADLRSTEHMREMQSWLASVIASAVTAAMRALAAEIPTDIAPAIRGSLVHELRDPELRAALDDLVDNATRRVLVTSRGELAEAQLRQRELGQMTPLEKVRRTLTLSWGVAIVFGAGSVGVLTWLLRQRRRTKRYRLALIDLMASIKRRDDGSSTNAEELGARTARLLEMLG